MNPQDMTGVGQGMTPEASMAQPEQSSQTEQDAPFDTYEKLRGAIMELLKQGLPGADQLLLAIDKIQTKNVMEATAQGAGGKSGIVSSQAGGQYGQAPTQPTQ